jgi:hypothetical protein
MGPHSSFDLKINKEVLKELDNQGPLKQVLTELDTPIDDLLNFE